MSVVLRIAGVEGALEVVCATGEERLGAPFRYDVTFASPDPNLDLDVMVGARCELRVRERSLHGVVREVHFDEHADGSGFRYRALVAPRVALLELSTIRAAHGGDSLPEIALSILASHGLLLGDVELRLARDHGPARVDGPPGEPALELLARVLAAGGMTYFFDHSAGRDVLVLTDDARTLPRLDRSSLAAVRTVRRLDANLSCHRATRERGPMARWTPTTEARRAEGGEKRPRTFELVARGSLELGGVVALEENGGRDVVVVNLRRAIDPSGAEQIVATAAPIEVALPAAASATRTLPVEATSVRGEPSPIVVHRAESRDARRATEGASLLVAPQLGERPKEGAPGFLLTVPPAGQEKDAAKLHMAPTYGLVSDTAGARTMIVHGNAEQNVRKGAFRGIKGEFMEVVWGKNTRIARGGTDGKFIGGMASELLYFGGQIDLNAGVGSVALKGALIDASFRVMPISVEWIRGRAIRLAQSDHFRAQRSVTFEISRDKFPGVAKKVRRSAFGVATIGLVTTAIASASAQTTSAYHGTAGMLAGCLLVSAGLLALAEERHVSKGFPKLRAFLDKRTKAPWIEAVGMEDKEAPDVSIGEKFAPQHTPWLLRGLSMPDEALFDVEMLPKLTIRRQALLLYTLEASIQLNQKGCTFIDGLKISAPGAKWIVREAAIGKLKAGTVKDGEVVEPLIQAGEADAKAKLAMAAAALKFVELPEVP